MTDATALGVVALTVMVPLPTGAHAVSLQDTSSATVAVPAVRTTCTRSAGNPRALIQSGVGPVAVMAAGVNVDPAHVWLAAVAVPSVAASTSGRRNFALPRRRLESVFASAACRLVRVDAFDPSFSTCVA